MKAVIDAGAKTPVRAHPFDAGLDLRAPYEVTVPAGGSAVIDTGVHVQVPAGYAGFIKPKSGLNVKHNLIADGVIDTGYTGTIVVKLYNLGPDDYQFEAGDKIAQLVIMSILIPDLEIVDSLETTERGANGFGSTGK